MCEPRKRELERAHLDVRLGERHHALLDLADVQVLHLEPLLTFLLLALLGVPQVHVDFPFG